MAGKSVRRRSAFVLTNPLCGIPSGRRTAPLRRHRNREVTLLGSASAQSSRVSTPPRNPLKSELVRGEKGAVIPAGSRPRIPRLGWVVVVDPG